MGCVEILSQQHKYRRILSGEINHMILTARYANLFHFVPHIPTLLGRNGTKAESECEASFDWWLVLSPCSSEGPLAGQKDKMRSCYNKDRRMLYSIIGHIRIYIHYRCMLYSGAKWVGPGRSARELYALPLYLNIRAGLLSQLPGCTCTQVPIIFHSTSEDIKTIQLDIDCV